MVRSKAPGHLLTAVLSAVLEVWGMGGRGRGRPAARQRWKAAVCALG